MKKSNFHITLSMVFLWTFACVPLLAQTNVNMANNGNTAGSPFTINPPATCFFNFFDFGGAGFNYNNGADAWITFAPANPATHRAQVSFLSFGLEPGSDALYIYNSDVVNTNQLVGPQGPTIFFPGNNWQNISPGTITANTGIAAVGANAAEALTFRFRSDNSVSAAGWSAIVRQVPIINCTMTAPVAQNVNTGALSTNCFVNVNTPLPTFAPGGCQAAYQLQYRINGGTPTTVVDPVTTNITAPVGTNVVTWELIDPCGGGVITSAVQLITVVDNTPPVMTCPANTTITLNAGLCELFNYAPPVTFTDNCPAGNAGQVNHVINFNSGAAGIMFNVTNLSSNPMTLTQFGPSLNPGTSTMEVYYTTNTISFVGQENNPAAWTFAGSQIVMSTSAAAGTAIPGFGITIPAGQTRGIYLTSTSGSPLNFTNPGNAFGDANLTVSNGTGKAYPFGANFANRAFNGFVKYILPGNNAAVQKFVVPNIVTPLGDPLEHDNTYTFLFEATDASGNVSTCSWNVTVQDFQNPITAMTCNDFVTLALGPECTGVLGADQMLEGGPFRCYDHYPVHVDKTPPYGNGPWEPAVFDCEDIGKTYRVRVFSDDDEDGVLDNTENKCFGDVKLVDNFPPQLDCSPIPITVPFNFPLDPSFTQFTSMQLPFKSQGLPMSLIDNQTREFNIPINLPMNANIEDVELRVKITGDAFFADLNIQIESPSGTIATVWDGMAICGPLPLFVRFDDEGLPPTICDNYTTDKHAQSLFGPGVLSIFDGETVNGTWKIRIADQNLGLDACTIEVADLHLTMSGLFGAGFPNGLSAPPVFANGFQSFIVPKSAAILSDLDHCSDVTLTYTDQSQNQNCLTGLKSIVTRRWMAKDASGNTATCNQTLHLLLPALTDVTFPPDYDGVDEQYFKCTIGQYPTPAWIESQGLQGNPTVFGFTNGGNIIWEHHDTPVWICDGSYSISREWTAIDGCTGQSTVHMQIIQVVDNEGPVFLNTPANVTVTTDPYDCCSSMDLPEVFVMDSCSRVNNIQAEVSVIDPETGFIVDVIPVSGGLFNFPGNLPNHSDTLGSFDLTPCIPVGEHIVTYIAQDDCGNTNSVSFMITVADYSPPSASCDETTIVAIGKDDPNDCYEANFANCDFAGVTWVKATTFDDGSYDECNNIKFSVRRSTPYSDCINDLNACEKLVATAESDSIKFYCCEVGTELMVILRVYQVDPNGNISLYPDGTPIYNECEVKVQVQDKLKPICESPGNVTVNCENFDPSLWTYGKPNVYDNCCLDTAYHYQGQKGLTHSVTYLNFDTVCSKGTILRTFKVYDCHGASSQCTQRIIVNYEQDFFIKFPNDAIVTVCDGTGMFGAPEFFGEDCELLGVSFTDQVYTVVPDACYKIERTWKIINWCTYQPDLGCVNVPNPNPHSNTNHSSNLPGPIVSAPGTIAPWASTVVKINPNDPAATNYSIFWNQDANCYEYKQIIKIVDQQAPIMVCPSAPQEFCDLTTNNAQLWNQNYWYDALSQSHDLCEAPVDLSISATDFCSGSNLNIRYLLFLDTDGDGSMETVVSSTNAPAAGTVNYNNLNTPNFTGGTPREFDQRAVAANQKYRFTLQTTVNGTNLGAAVRWNTPAGPANYAIPELPYGMHKIKWIASDGCGNESVCEYTFIVKDCKAPSVICQNGLTGSLAQTGQITLYASDFLLHAEDNCTPEDNLLFAIKKCNGPAGFPVDANGNPNISITFDCAEVGIQCIELWAQDAYGNADYCETYIIVQDNAGNCGATTATVAGLLKTEMGDGLEETDVELAGPTFNMFDMTDQDGHYSFSNSVPMHADYTVTPTKDDNPLNGVTTYDLVLISKHILGIEPLSTPYKMIAADANLSGSITTFDIVELRKLILGIYTELPANNSWRFVDKSYAFPNTANPFQTTFPETKTVADIQANAMEDNFVAIKVGDVNNTAIANALMASEERTTGTFLFDVEDRDVKAGEVFEVKFKATEKAAGYQFTLNYNDLELTDVVPGPGMKADNFATFPAENALTTSFNGVQQAEFTLKFKAKKAGELSKMIGVSSRITKAESYQVDETANQQIRRSDVALRFNGKGGSTISGVGFELYQNQPNPFVNRTLVGFHLPEASAATLSVFDQAGRLIYQQKGDFPKGYNTIPLEKALLNTAGVLYYTLEAANNSASKTMIQAK